MKKKIDIVY